jgi:hypothetical protein
MARRDDSNRFVVSVTMFNRTTDAPTVVLLILVGVLIATGVSRWWWSP